jgi:hypothetical protein
MWLGMENWRTPGIVLRYLGRIGAIHLVLALAVGQM